MGIYHTITAMEKVFDRIVILGADHNGVALKAEVKKFLTSAGYFCIDLGPLDEKEKVDYVDYAKTLSHIVDNEEAKWGILMCGTGVGMSMVANRLPNVRASLVHSLDVAQKTREHNDANVLCLGAWVNSLEDNLKIVGIWFNEPFGEGRHVRRVEKTKKHNKEKVVFANGVFDILHPGHIQLLKFAKSLGSKFVVAINSDRSTKALKGEGRPVNSEGDRKTVLESLGFIDEVLIFDELSPAKLINQLKPNIMVKGEEWTAEEIRKRDAIPPEIDIKVYPLVTGYSTTSIIRRINARSQNNE